MLKNHLYNLMIQLVEENKSVWRIKEKYMKDSENCPDCTPFWEDLVKEKEMQISKLMDLIKSHIND